MLPTWVQSTVPICFGEPANIVFKTATNDSYPKTWYLPTKYSSIHKTNVFIQGNGNFNTCMLSYGLWHLIVLCMDNDVTKEWATSTSLLLCTNTMCRVSRWFHMTFSNKFGWVYLVRKSASPTFLFLQRWPSAQSFINWGSMLPHLKA